MQRPGYPPAGGAAIIGRMRLIHTSDWHLGQTLHEQERGYEHAAFLDWLLATLERERPDLLVIAGDVYDSVNPPVSAQRQLYGFVVAATRRLPRMTIAMIAGNHDSGARIEMPAPLLAGFGAHAIGRVPWRADGTLDAARLLLPVPGADGAPLGWVLALPFLRPAELAGAADGDYPAAIARVHAELIEHARAVRQPGQLLVAVSHAHLAGGATSDSERNLVAGGAEALPPALFPADLDYVALGHLHLAQAVAGPTAIRYCGSPLPLSFAEVDYPHQVLRVDLEPGAPARVTSLPVPRALPLLRVPKAGPAPLPEVLAELAALALPERPPEQRPFLQARVLLDAPVVDLRARVEAALAGKPVRLVHIKPDYRKGERGDDAPPSFAPAAPAELFARAWERRYGRPPDARALADFAQIEAEAEGAG